MLPENYVVSEEEPLPDLMATEVQFLDNTKTNSIRPKVLIELSEKNVNYSSENFEVEIYEIIENNSSEQLVQIETMEELTDLFIVKTDESVDRYLSLKRLQQSGLFGFRERGRIMSSVFPDISVNRVDIKNQTIKIYASIDTVNSTVRPFWLEEEDFAQFISCEFLIFCILWSRLLNSVPMHHLQNRHLIY